MNYLSVSKPPNIGEPIKTANVTTIAKPIPTTIKRLFILEKIQQDPDKKELQMWYRCGRTL